MTPSPASKFIRAVAKLTLVLVGLVVLVVIFFWPALLKLPSSSTPNIFSHLFLVVGHISLLIFNDGYLYIHRKAILPIRYLLMPILMTVMKSEAVRNEESTWYARVGTGNNEPKNTKDLPHTDSPAVLMQSLSRHVRRDIKRKLRCYRDSGIETSTSHNGTFSLRKDIPVLTDHERKAVRGTNKSFLDEFIQRFLVIFMVTGGYIDRYYEPGNDDRPVALNLFVQNGKVLHALMYFCVERHSTSGIWHYAMLRMMLRAASASNVPSSPDSDDRHSDVGLDSTSPSSPASTPLLADETTSQTPSSVKKIMIQTPIEYVNFLAHQDHAKKCAGAKEASWADEELMDALYPIQFFQEPPAHIIPMDLDLSPIL